MLSLPLYYIVKEVVMEQWSRIQDLLTSNGKLPMSIEVTFGMQKISKMLSTEPTTNLATVLTEYGRHKMPLNASAVYMPMHPIWQNALKAVA